MEVGRLEFVGCYDTVTYEMLFSLMKLGLLELFFDTWSTGGLVPIYIVEY